MFNIKGRVHLYVCMFYGFCVFCLDEVGLQPLVLWYTKNSFTSLHGKCSVIHGSNAGNARHLYLSLCYKVCCAMLNCRRMPVSSFDVFLLCDCLPCTGHSLGLVQSWTFHLRIFIIIIYYYESLACDFLLT